MSANTPNKDRWHGDLKYFSTQGLTRSKALWSLGSCGEVSSVSLLHPCCALLFQKSKKKKKKMQRFLMLLLLNNYPAGDFYCDVFWGNKPCWFNQRGFVLGYSSIALRGPISNQLKAHHQAHTPAVKENANPCHESNWVKPSQHMRMENTNRHFEHVSRPMLAFYSKHSCAWARPRWHGCKRLSEQLNCSIVFPFILHLIYPLIV